MPGVDGLLERVQDEFGAQRGRDGPADLPERPHCPHPNEVSEKAGPRHKDTGRRACAFEAWDFAGLVWDLGFGIRDLGFGIWDVGFGWALGFGIFKGLVYVPPMAPHPRVSAVQRWLARIHPYAADLAVGTYELFGQGAPMYVEDSYDHCSGFGARGWDGEPAWLTIESIDATHAVITIEGAYDDVDGTWDVALCAGVTPAP